MKRQIIQINESDLRGMIKATIMNVFGRVDLSDGTYEFEDENRIKKYSHQVWNILQTAYKPEGGFYSYSSVKDMEKLTSLMVICVKNRRIVACAIYRDDLGGQKLNGCGTIDGSNENKSLLRQIIRDDIENMEKYHWVEVSYPLEKWFKEMGGNPVPAQLAHSLLHKSKSKITILDDNVHYKREIGRDGMIATKIIYGFSSHSVYEKVMKNLESYTGFDNYAEFKDYVNNLPKINENFDYLDNNENKEVALAMEIVIQIGNLWEDGGRELTPKMHKLLQQSISVLLNCTNKTNQIASLIKHGRYYLDNMDVLECNTTNNFNYIISPAF